MSNWINCPVCGSSDTREESDKDEPELKLIYCTNHNCGSNGGDNWSAYENKQKPPFMRVPYWQSKELTLPEWQEAIEENVRHLNNDLNRVYEQLYGSR